MGKYHCPLPNYLFLLVHKNQMCLFTGANEYIQFQSWNNSHKQISFAHTNKIKCRSLCSNIYYCNIYILLQCEQVHVSRMCLMLYETTLEETKSHGTEPTFENRLCTIGVSKQFIAVLGLTIFTISGNQMVQLEWNHVLQSHPNWVMYQTMLIAECGKAVHVHYWLLTLTSHWNSYLHHNNPFIRNCITTDMMVG